MERDGAAMSEVLVNVKLTGFLGLTEVQRELERGPIAIELAEDLTVAGLLDRLAERWGAPFRRRTLTAGGRVRSGVRLFVDDEVVESGTPLAAAIRPGSKITVVVLMAQTMGG
jgi:hypothetical protein